MNAWDLSASGLLLSFSPNDRRARESLITEQTVLLIDRTQPVALQVGARRFWTQIYDGRYSIADPFTSPTYAAMIGNRVYSSGSGSWQLNVFDRTGSLLRILRYPISRFPVTRRLIAAERQRISSLSDAPHFLRLFDELELADSTSAIRRLKATSDGMLWVERWHSHVARIDEVWDVLNAEGIWLRTIRVPAEAGSFLDARGDLLVTVWRDDLDVPYVRVYRMMKSRLRK